MQSMFQFIPEWFSTFEVRALHRKLQISSPKLVHRVFMELCAQVHCHAGTGLGLLVPVKGNCHATAYQDIMYSYMLSSLCQQFWEGPHKGIMVKYA